MGIRILGAPPSGDGLIATLAYDDSSQVRSGIYISCVPTLNGVDIGSNPGVQHTMTFTLNGDDLFTITANGGDTEGLWVWSNWHLSIDAPAQALIQANFAGEMGSTGFEMVDNLSGIFPILVSVGLISVTSPSYNPSIPTKGFARAITYSCSFGALSASPIEQVISNEVYQAITFEMVGAVSQSVYVVSHDTANIVEWGDNSYDFGPLSEITHSYKPIHIGIGGFWGSALTAFDLENGKGMSSLDMSYATCEDAYLTINGMIGFTTLLLPMAGSIIGLNINSNASLNLGDVDMSAMTATDAGITIGDCAINSFESPNGTYLSLSVHNTTGNANCVFYGTLGTAYVVDITANAGISAGVMTNIYANIDAMSTSTPPINGTVNSKGSAQPTGGMLNASVVSLIAKGVTVTL